MCRLVTSARLAGALDGVGDPEHGVSQATIDYVAAKNGVDPSTLVRLPGPCDG